MSLKMMPLVLVLVAPLAALAHGPHGPGGGPGKPPSSLELLLMHQQELALTAEQVAQVEALQAALEQKSAPLHEQLHAMRPPRPSGPPPSETERMNRPPADSEAMRERMLKAEPLLNELRANDAAAYQEAAKLLSAAQQARAEELIAQEREAHHRRHEAKGQRMLNRQ